MQNKKYVWGSVIAGITFCAVLVFNCFVFPVVLAQSPEDSEVETVLTSAVSEPAEQLSGTDDLPGINVIPKERAIQIAADALSGTKNVSGLPYVIKYTRDVMPSNPVLCYIVFYDGDNGYYAQINAMTGEVVDLEEFSGILDITGDKSTFFRSSIAVDSSN